MGAYIQSTGLLGYLKFKRPTQETNRSISPDQTPEEQT